MNLQEEAKFADILTKTDHRRINNVHVNTFFCKLIYIVHASAPLDFIRRVCPHARYKCSQTYRHRANIWITNILKVLAIILKVIINNNKKYRKGHS